MQYQTMLQIEEKLNKYSSEYEIKNIEALNVFISAHLIIYMNDLNAFEEIKLSTYYDIDKYYYAEPIVYCAEKSKEILLDKYSPNLKIKTVR